MKGLYFRLLLWLAAAFLAVGAVPALSLFELVSDGPPPLQDFMKHHLESTAYVVLEIYERDGAEAAREFMKASAVNSEFRWHLYIPNDNLFSLDRIPQVLHHDLWEAYDDDRLHLFNGRPGDGEEEYYGAVRRVQLEGRPPIAVMLEGHDLEPVVDALTFYKTLVLRGAFMLLGVVTVCYGLYRSLVRPLRQLEAATGRLGEGDLASRVSESVIRREDEFASVARSFNTMAQRVERLVASQKQLLHDVSHEFRSPLTRIGLAVELARNHQGADSSVDSLGRITKEVETLDSLISQLLTLSRIDANTDVGEHERVDLVALLESMIEDARFESAGSELNIQLQYDQPAYVRANMQLLYSAVENVLRNAVRHAPAGSNIDVTLHRAGANTEIQVRDYGAGVEESQLSQLFVPFYSTAQEDGHSVGAGIGLSITQRAILQLGGTVSATNAEGGGLQIVIQLPKDLSVELDDVSGQGMDIPRS